MYKKDPHKLMKSKKQNNKNKYFSFGQQTVNVVSLSDFADYY